MSAIIHPSIYPSLPTLDLSSSLDWKFQAMNFRWSAVTMRGSKLEEGASWLNQNTYGVVATVWNAWMSSEDDEVMMIERAHHHHHYHRQGDHHQHLDGDRVVQVSGHASQHFAYRECKAMYVLLSMHLRISISICITHYISITHCMHCLIIFITVMHLHLHHSLHGLPESMFHMRILLSTDELMSTAAMPTFGSNTFRAVKPVVAH